MGSPRKTARGLGAKAMVSDDKVVAAISDALQVAADVIDEADKMVSQREKSVKVAEKAVEEASAAFEAAEDQAMKAVEVFEVLEVAEQKVNEKLAEK